MSLFRSQISKRGWLRIVQFAVFREQKVKIGEVGTVKVLKDGKLMAICKEETYC